MLTSRETATKSKCRPKGISVGQPQNQKVESKLSLPSLPGRQLPPGAVPPEAATCRLHRRTQSKQLGDGNREGMMDKCGAE